MKCPSLHSPASKITPAKERCEETHAVRRREGRDVHGCVHQHRRGRQRPGMKKPERRYATWCLRQDGVFGVSLHVRCGCRQLRFSGRIATGAGYRTSTVPAPLNTKRIEWKEPVSKPTIRRSRRRRHSVIASCGEPWPGLAAGGSALLERKSSACSE